MDFGERWRIHEEVDQEIARTVLYHDCVLHFWFSGADYLTHQIRTFIEVVFCISRESNESGYMCTRNVHGIIWWIYVESIQQQARRRKCKIKKRGTKVKEGRRRE